MLSTKQFSYATLCLILASSFVVLLLGIRFAREETIIAVEQDQTPLSRFTSRFLHEIESLDDHSVTYLRSRTVSGSEPVKSKSLRSAGVLRESSRLPFS